MRVTSIKYCYYYLKQKFMKVQNNKNVNNYECLVRRTFYCLGSCPFYPSKTVVQAVKGLQFFHVQYNLH